MKYILAPSILSADFKDLGNDIKKVADAGAEAIHVDVMDGMFVPSISFGMPVIKSVRSATDKFFDVHLMVENPERYLKDFAESGADGITVHFEACRDVKAALKEIHALGLKAGLAINPGTDVSVLYDFIDDADMFLIMTVNPGFGGQKYIEGCTEKISALKNKLTELKKDIDIEVDGGIGKGTIDTALDAGANVIVIGSAIFGPDAAEKTEYYAQVLKNRER